jgi:hypothetical protein
MIAFIPHWPRVANFLAVLPEISLQFLCAQTARNAQEVQSRYAGPDKPSLFEDRNTAVRIERKSSIKGGAIIDHETPRERCFVAVQK